MGIGMNKYVDLRLAIEFLKFVKKTLNCGLESGSKLQ